MFHPIINWIREACSTRHTQSRAPLFEGLEGRVFLSAAPLVAVSPAKADAPMANQAAVRVALASKAQPAKAVVSTIIDHTSVAKVSNLSQATMDRIASQLNFFFAHASVGGNIVEGANILHNGNGRRFKLQTTSVEATPPEQTAKGMIYDYDRGNPDWKTKVDQFKADMADGWAGKANVVLNKFCYIDPNVTLQYYAISNGKGSAMRQLEAAYPNTKFVYMTIPLTTDADRDNILRNKFNTALRKWAKTNNKLLFDIADIEAHNTSGVQSTFKSGGVTYQKLFSGYSSDGGHLNGAGSKRAALAFYALGAAIVK